MAVRVPKSARFTLVLDAGINQATGAMIKKSISFGKLMPNSNAGSVEAVANAIGDLLVKSVVDVTITEVDQII